MRLFIIIGLALAVAAQGLSKEERDAIKVQKSAERKANKSKNKNNKKNKTTTTDPPTTTTTSTTSTTTTTTTTTSTTTKSTTTTTTPKPTTTKATTKRTKAQKPQNSGRAVSQGATMCVNCNQQDLAACLTQTPFKCPENTYCMLTMRTQNGVANQYEVGCKQNIACISNKRLNGSEIKIRPNDQCYLTGKKASTCRQCCTGSKCLEFYANFAEEEFYSTRWNWNTPRTDSPIFA